MSHLQKALIASIFTNALFLIDIFLMYKSYVMEKERVERYSKLCVELSNEKEEIQRFFSDKVSHL